MIVQDRLKCPNCGNTEVKLIAASDMGVGKYYCDKCDVSFYFEIKTGKTW